MGHQKHIVITTLSRGTVDFNLRAWRDGDGKIAFLEEVFFIQPELPEDEHVFGAADTVIWEEFCLCEHRPRHPAASVLKRRWLSELRALPMRALRITQDRGVFKYNSSLWLALHMLQAVWTEFTSPWFWRNEGMDQLILTRENIEEIFATLEAFQVELKAHDRVESWQLQNVIDGAMRIRRYSKFKETFDALPRR
jgi:hypothetical protein